jgi:hypothetical protein
MHINFLKKIQKNGAMFGFVVNIDTDDKTLKNYIDVIVSTD